MSNAKWEIYAQKSSLQCKWKESTHKGVVVADVEFRNGGVQTSVSKSNSFYCTLKKNNTLSLTEITVEAERQT